jgi:hypothetical protein
MHASSAHIVTYYEVSAMILAGLDRSEAVLQDTKVM